MPYLILVIGLIIGFYALYRFFLNANIDQIKAFFASSLTAIFGVALLYLALTGKLIAALAGLIGIVPVVIGWVKKHKNSKNNNIIDVEPIEVEDIKPEDEADEDKD